MKPLHRLLLDWQEHIGLTTLQAAARCHVSRQQWHELISGGTTDPRASTLRKLAAGTGIPLERLVDATGAVEVHS